MRTIKFRVWDKELKRVSYTGGGGLYSSHMTKDFQPFILNGNGKQTILMQYTGLKDKDGIEIYEGDIVDYWYNMNIKPDKPSRGFILWVAPEFTIEKDEDLISKPLDYFTHMGCLEVIGNIWENKELLK